MEGERTSENHPTSAAAFVEGGIQDACDDACSICLEVFCDSDPSTVTNCRHEFHLQCILEWCQRSSQCPMCLQVISLKDPSSQDLLDTVELERNMRMNPPRNTTIFRHPTLGEFELQHLPISDSELEERIIQHLAASAAMGRARQLARREVQRSRSSTQGHPHFLVFTTHPNAPSGTSVPSSIDQRDGSGSTPAFRIVGSNSSFITTVEDSARLITQPSSGQADQILTSASGSSVVVSQHVTSSSNRSSPTHTSPSNQRARSSEFQSFSESLKSRVSAWSMRYKESITKSTRGWKEKLFARNSSVLNPSTEILREADQFSSPVSRLMDHLDIKEDDITNLATVSTSTVDSAPADTPEQQLEEAGDGLSSSEGGTRAPCVTNSASC